MKKLILLSILLIVGCEEDNALEQAVAEIEQESEECAGTFSAGTFTYNQSSLQAFYYFSLVTIDGVLVDSDDWVGAFKDDVCVGARKWDTSQCGSGVCDLPAMGDDGNDATVGYMTSGDIPSFKIYDASEERYYDATPSEYIPWTNYGINSIESLNATTNP